MLENIDIFEFYKKFKIMSHKLKIVLKYTDPQVYRTVIVPEKFTFHELHNVIQCVMNWENAHLYQFNLGAPYGSDSIKLLDNQDKFGSIFGKRFQDLDSTETFLSEIFNDQKKKINYIYDFGDGWHHEIRVLQKPKEEVLYPKCIKGENAAPIEDCGSYPGFYDLIEISKKSRKTEEDKEMLEWYGIPNGVSFEKYYAFDLEEANAMLLEYFEK